MGFIALAAVDYNVSKAGKANGLAEIVTKIPQMREKMH
jgi:hypothetical protein